MPFSVVTNNNAMAALQALNATQRSMASTQNRITTGLKVAGAADNASTFTIAQGMRGDIAGLKAASQSIALGKSTVGVALKAAEQVSEKLNELKGKVTEGQGQNVDLAKIQQDMNSIVNSISDIVSAAQFNGVNLLDGSSSSGLDVLTGLNRTSATAESIASYNVAAQDLTTTQLGVNSLSVTGDTSITFDQGTGLAFAQTDTLKVVLDHDGDTGTAGDQLTLIFELTKGAAALTNKTTTTMSDWESQTTAAPVTGTIAFAVVSDVTVDTPQQTLAEMFDVMRSAGLTVTTADDGSFSVASSYTLDEAGTVASNADIVGRTQYDTDGDGTADAKVGTAASVAFDAVNTAIDTVNAAVASLGTSSNSLDASAKFVSSLTDVLTEGVGQLVDADMAEESANLQALQTRQQLGIQALSIANSQPGSILALFRG